MTSNRIQKLLFSEYSDFEDIVLVEGPFAETDREGKGIRQVQIGLTPTKLILACYFVEPVSVEELGDQWVPRRGQDPDIENFELVSAYPVESVNLSVYRHRRRKTLKARFCNGKVVYYEIGGWQERKMLWSLWCERIRFLSPYESATSVSETSVGSSSSGTSSLYIVRSSLSVTQAGKPTLWCHYACTEGSWADPHLYLGPKFYDKGVNISTLPHTNGDLPRGSTAVSKTEMKTRRKRESKEPLILSTEHEVMAAEALEVWGAGRTSSKGCRIRRRYAFSPCPYLLGGIGPWRVPKPLAYSLQTKKNVSLVDLRDDAEDFTPPMPKGSLLRTASVESLSILAGPQERLCPKSKVQQHDELSFWTRYPGDLLQWGPAQFKAQQCYLRTARKPNEPHNFGIKEKNKISKKQSRSKTIQNPSIRQRKLHYSGGGDSLPSQRPYKGEDTEGWLVPVSFFSSSSLSHQLTMIHKHLFLQLTTLDLGRARLDMSSWRAPPLRVLVYLSCRISCVVATHILLEREIHKRARVVVKFISVAFKCHSLHSQMSTEAVLRGLHSPPIYRLHHTWAFVRKHHATVYRRFEDLSRRYYDCREPLFQKTYDDTVQFPPFLPSLSLLVAVLLESIPDVPRVPSFRFTTDCSESCHQARVMLHSSSSARTAAAPRTLRRFLSSLHLSSSPPLLSPPQELSPCQSDTHLHSVSRETLLEHLDWFFTPVSNTPTQRVLQDIEYFLESHQAAASRYQIPINPRVRAFLLHSRHPDMRTLYKQSLLIEP